MIHTKSYATAYIVNRDGRLIRKLIGFNIEDLEALHGMLPFISCGDILRCFTSIGFVDTYVINIIKYQNWPSIIRLEKLAA
jgi:hypothetical protein